MIQLVGDMNQLGLKQSQGASRLNQGAPRRSESRGLDNVSTGFEIDSIDSEAFPSGFEIDSNLSETASIGFVSRVSTDDAGELF